MLLFLKTKKIFHDLGKLDHFRIADNQECLRG